jgi:hypothetical protein
MMLISDVNSKLPYRLLKDVSVTKHKQNQTRILLVWYYMILYDGYFLENGRPLYRKGHNTTDWLTFGNSGETNDEDVLTLTLKTTV